MFPELKTSIRRLESENSEIRLMNSHYMRKIRALEKDSKENKDKMRRFQEKNFRSPGSAQQQELYSGVSAIESTSPFNLCVLSLHLLLAG